MYRYTRLLIAVGCLILFSTSLVSCTGNPKQAIPTPQSSSTSSHLSPESGPSREHLEPSHPDSPIQTSSPASSPLESESVKPSEEVNEQPIEAVTSTIEPEPSSGGTPAATAFQADSPSLSGIKLGSSEQDVLKKFGKPIDSYSFPQNNQSIQIWEYAGLSIGLNSNQFVVYIEVSSPEADTGLLGMEHGMPGTQAAELLGASTIDLTPVLIIQVSGGLLKLDLDPDDYTVHSIKLISSEL